MCLESQWVWVMAFDLCSLQACDGKLPPFAAPWFPHWGLSCTAVIPVQPDSPWPQKSLCAASWWGEVSVRQPCPTLCDPMDGSPPGSSVHGILQARTLEWVATPFIGSSRPRDRTQASCLCRQILYCVSHQGSPLHPGECPKSLAEDSDLLECSKGLHTVSQHLSSCC